MAESMLLTPVTDEWRAWIASESFAFPRWVRDMIDGPDDWLVPVCVTLWRSYDFPGTYPGSPLRWPTRAEMRNRLSHRYGSALACEDALAHVANRHHEVFEFVVGNTRGRPSVYYGFRPWLHNARSPKNIVASKVYPADVAVSAELFDSYSARWTDLEA